MMGVIPINVFSEGVPNVIKMTGHPLSMYKAAEAGDNAVQCGSISTCHWCFQNKQNKTHKQTK